MRLVMPLFQMSIKLFETSAKENINVEEMFRSVTELVLRSKLDQQQRLNNQSDLSKHESGIKLTGEINQINKAMASVQPRLFVSINH